MDPTKWRISKACEECRVRKIRCDGGSPCQRCSARSVACEYRKKARNRMRKEAAGPPSVLSASQGSKSGDTGHEAGGGPADLDSASGYDNSPASRHVNTRNSIHNHSVAATHRASPSVFLQLYYGPSSNFTLLNSIYHQLEGTRPAPDAAKEVEEIGPGLDLFNSRRLYFGDLVGVTDPSRTAAAAPGIFLDRCTAGKFMDRYLTTYWHVLPIWSKDEFRNRLDRLYGSLETYSTEDPDAVIVVLAMAIGASVLENESTAYYLFRKAKKWSAALDDMVNIQTVQIALLIINARPNSGFLAAGVAVRKAVAAGLHKDVIGAAQSQEDTRQGRITIWCVFFWEIWLCFSLGRPSSFPESDIDVPFPSEEKMLQSLVTLARLMSKCVTRIYKQHHESLLPIWNAAIDIRRELRQFARQQQQDHKFGLVGDAYAGELGVCQTMVSTMYHHTLLLTFRPFLVLRAKLQQDAAAVAGPAVLPTPPAWLDTACDYCIDAARHTISYLAGACEKNELCRAIKYHGFFLEGASHVLAFYLLQDKTAGRANFPWLQLAARALQLMKPNPRSTSHPVNLASNLERMIQSVYPDFRLEDLTPSDLLSPGHDDVAARQESEVLAIRTTAPTTASSMVLFPSTPFGLDDSGPPSTESPSTSTLNPEAPADLTAADLGWNFDFSTMNMEAFLTIDPNMAMDFTTYSPGKSWREFAA